MLKGGKDSTSQIVAELSQDRICGRLVVLPESARYGDWVCIDNFTHVVYYSAAEVS
jgi:hypothetical protein